ncbi:MAG: HAD-IIIA family hydrolase [Candidatus Omnitrophica bacterium]|nr:HAD-IIIA family hydrolase [Candidatus Omnitrophota bacterium]
MNAIDKKIIFIDRDGVINKDPGGWVETSYVTRWEDFIFLPGSPEALKKLCDAGYGIVIISNQGGVSKGFFTEERLAEINSKMLRALREKGVAIKKVYYCIHQASDNCECKKPKTGLFEKAEKELRIKAAGNYFIGDGKMDVEAGSKAALKTVLVLSGKTNVEMLRDWDVKPDYIFDNLAEAVDFILGRK